MNDENMPLVERVSVRRVRPPLETYYDGSNPGPAGAPWTPPPGMGRKTARQRCPLLRPSDDNGSDQDDTAKVSEGALPSLPCTVGAVAAGRQRGGLQPPRRHRPELARPPAQQPRRPSSELMQRPVGTSQSARPRRCRGMAHMWELLDHSAVVVYMARPSSEAALRRLASQKP